MNRSVWVGIVAALGAVAYWLKVLKVPTATIRVFSTKDGCRSETSPSPLHVQRDKDVEWVINDEGCLGTASVELQFKTDPSPTHPDRPKAKRKIKAKIKRNAPTGTRRYSVWYVGDDGTRYEMEDPEIQIN